MQQLKSSEYLTNKLATIQLEIEYAISTIYIDRLRKRSSKTSKISISQLASFVSHTLATSFSRLSPNSTIL